MKIKKGDSVKMLVGKDRNKTGKVLHVFPKEGRIVIEGMNKIKKHMRAKKQGQKGQVIEKERAVDISNAQLICTKCSKPTRINYRIEGNKKVRFCKKCEGVI